MPPQTESFAGGLRVSEESLRSIMLSKELARGKDTVRILKCFPEFIDFTQKMLLSA